MDIISVFLIIQGNFYLLAFKMPSTIYLSRHLIRNNLYFKVIYQFSVSWTGTHACSKIYFLWIIGRKHFLMKKAELWNKLPKETVKFPLLEIFRV